MLSPLADDRRSGRTWPINGMSSLQRCGYCVVYRLVIGILAGFCIIHVDCWLVSYLEWPWSPDHDVFATLARSWDAGVLPYRDLYANNPPPTIYLYWLLGKTFGWGRTVPILAFDAALVFVLAAVMILWSERVFATALPGLLGLSLFLRYYLPLDYTMIGERDWHASLLAAVALMLIQGWPKRQVHFAAATAMALAVATRPQAALFLPAAGLAIASGPRGVATSGRSVTRSELEFALVVTGCFALMFAPLLLAGVLDDFLRSLHRAAYGGIRNPLTPAILIDRVSGLLAQGRVAIPIATAAVLVCCPRSRDRRLARVWLVAMIASVLYKPISPRQHDYLYIPRFLISSIVMATVAGLGRGKE